MSNTALVSWDGTYGYGAGRAHPCVEHVACPVCGAPPGVLCMGVRRRKLDRHYKRAYAYRDLKAAARKFLRGRV